MRSALKSITDCELSMGYPAIPPTCELDCSGCGQLDCGVPCGSVSGDSSLSESELSSPEYWLSVPIRCARRACFVRVVLRQKLLESQPPSSRLDRGKLPLVTLPDGTLIRPLPCMYPPVPRKARGLAERQISNVDDLARMVLTSEKDFPQFGCSQW